MPVQNIIVVILILFSSCLTATIVVPRARTFFTAMQVGDRVECEQTHDGLYSCRTFGLFGYEFELPRVVTADYNRNQNALVCPPDDENSCWVVGNDNTFATWMEYNVPNTETSLSVACISIALASVSVTAWIIYLSVDRAQRIIFELVGMYLKGQQNTSSGPAIVAARPGRPRQPRNVPFSPTSLGATVA